MVTGKGFGRSTVRDALVNAELGANEEASEEASPDSKLAFVGDLARSGGAR